MLTPRQFDAFTPKRRAEIQPAYLYIPPNRHGIRSGYYRELDIAPLLRRPQKRSPVLAKSPRSGFCFTR
jgi:hypothetical protein